MNPNQPSYSVDYLNQIAPQAPKRRGLSHKQTILAIAGGFAVLLVIMLSIIVTSSGSKKPEQHLAARLLSTETIVGGAQGKLKSTQLRTLNSNLSIYLTNTNRDIAAPLLKGGIDVTKLDKKVIASESGKTITDKLEDARLNADFDRTYAREIAYRLETITLLMKQLYGSTSSKSFKTFLDNAYTNLEPTQKQFADFNAANG